MSTMTMLKTLSLCAWNSKYTKLNRVQWRIKVILRIELTRNCYKLTMLILQSITLSISVFLFVIFSLCIGLCLSWSICWPL